MRHIAVCLAAASLLLRAADPDQIRAAQKELFAARYDSAAELCAKILREDPAWAPGYYCQVRALIEARRAREAYAVADEGIRHAHQSAEAQTASGLAMFRRGEMAKAELAFREALRTDSKYPGALSGMAAIYRLTSKFQTARQYLNMAWHFAPDDPDLIIAHANTLHGAPHIAALETALAVYDPASREARSLRAHIAADKTLADRKLRRLVTPYQHYSLKLARIGPTPSHPIGVGLHAKLNGGPIVRLLLDTGASGIAISSKAAEKAGLERLGGEASEVHGIGDRKPQDSYRYLVKEIGVGELTFADYPVSVFDSARDPNHDGLIGADVFRRFLVSIDFPKLELALDPFAAPPEEDEDPPDAAPLQPGFFRAFRFGNHLTLPTQVNGSGSRLFLIDSGSSANLVDTGSAKESTHVYGDDTVLKGVQGRVKNVSRASRMSLTFAGFRARSLDMLSMDMEPLSDGMGSAISGLLGMPVLWQVKLTIDYRDGAVKFEYHSEKR